MSLLTKLSVFLIFLSLRISAETFKDNRIVPKGSRLFSIAITPPKIKELKNLWKAYEDAIDLAIETGIDLPGELSFSWSEIENRSIFGGISYRDDNSKKLIEILKRKQIASRNHPPTI